MKNSPAYACPAGWQTTVTLPFSLQTAFVSLR